MNNLNLGPNLPVITVLYAKNHSVKAYNLRIPKHGRSKTFTDLIQMIELLREQGKDRCYIIEREQCFILRWGPLLAPWEGPRA